MIDDKHPPSSIQSANFFSYMTFSWIQPKILYGRVSSGSTCTRFLSLTTNHHSSLHTVVLLIHLYVQSLPT